MDSETFKMRKQFLKDFYNEDRVEFLKNCGKIFIGNFSGHNGRFNGRFFIDTEVYFYTPLKNYHMLLKPFIYFLYSFTYRKNFFKHSVLLLDDVKITYYIINLFNEKDLEVLLFFPYLSITNFLNKIHVNYNIKGINEIHIKLLSYYNVNYEQYRILGGNIEEQEEQEENITREVKIINSSQSFKSVECVICLSNPPNVLFCNCGHLCLCSECEKLKISNKCPICKIENVIIRVLN